MINTMQNLPDPPAQGAANVPVPASGNPSYQGSDIASESSVSGSTGLQKEQEPISSPETATLEEVGTDIELEPELEALGVSKHSETIELPPDIARMGVYATGSTQPVITAGTVQLPLTDDQIIVGLHAQIISSLRWLAEWCIKQLKKAHIHLKSMGGKIVRETI